MKFYGALALFMGLTLAACGEKKEARASRTADGESSRDLCLADSSFGEKVAFVCDLYNSAPATSDSGGKHPFKDFRYSFHLDPDAPLPEFVELLLYGAPFQRITDFRIRPADPSTGGDVEVRFANYGREEVLLFDLQNFDDEYSVREIRYTSGYTVSERAGRAEKEPTPDLHRRYLKARKTWRDAIEYDGPKYDAYLELSAKKRHILTNKRFQAEAFLKAKIVSLTGLKGHTLIEGFEIIDPLNHLLASDYDAGHCLDGVRFKSGDQNLIVTTPGLFEIAKEEGLLGNPPSFAQGLYTASRFYSLAEIPVTAPEGFEEAKVLIGLDGQDVPQDPQPETFVVKAVRGGRIYLLASPFENGQALAECAGGGEDEARNKAERVDETYAAYQKCFAARLPSHPSYPGLVERAQALVNRIATFQ